MKKRSCKYLEEFVSMPPLYHTLPGQEYSQEKSEVFEWIRKNDELFYTIMNRAWDSARHYGIVRYNKNTGKWSGTECEQK